ncbi:GNAT family N-acetyltransferase [Chloroflexota bacterium]
MKKKKRPSIKTERLRLQPYTLEDAPDLQRLIGERDVAATLLNVPYPYEDGMAEEWISKHQKRFDKEEAVEFAIVDGKEGFLMGTIGIERINKEYENAEIGYWIALPYWGNGYCTEAAQAVIKYGFEVLGLHRIYAQHFTSNPASGRIMQKIGMKYEGCLRQNVKKWGRFENMAFYGILKSEYNKTT